ncbi:HAD family hydrolase [Haloferula sargassicola]|uniref:phosphoglycolate phosphatase n=1 Tax=Haloferula sargassicola TaxID=490096 RepID=A0ABP9UNK5_9BACT
MTEALIFDLDGTLVDSLPGIAAALNAALSDAGLPTHPEEKVRDFVGSGSLELARRALPARTETTAEALEAAFRDHYAHTWREGTEFYPGIEEMLASLGGRKLALLSNKPHSFTREIADFLFEKGLFDRVLGQSDDFPRKPAPDSTLALLAGWGISPENARFVGDSAIDRQTAENAGVPFIGVTWGYHHGADLGPVTIQHPRGLSAALG